MKSKILFICCFILLLCGCSKKEDTKTEELLTNNDIGFTIIVEDGRGITKDSRINHINDYIGDQYIESKKNNDTVYYNDSIQITLNKKNKVKKVELFTDHYKVEGNFYVGLEKNNLDYENHKEANNQYIAYSENDLHAFKQYNYKNHISLKIVINQITIFLLISSFFLLLQSF